MNYLKKLAVVGAVLCAAFLFVGQVGRPGHNRSHGQPGVEGAPDLAFANIYYTATAVWTFNDPADLGADSVGTNDLTPVASPTPTGGALGYAASFNGSTQRAETATEIHSASMDFSISSWVIGTNDDSTNDWAGSWSAWMNRVNVTTRLQTAFLNGFVTGTSDTAVPVGARSHLCVVYDDDGVTTDIYFYLNGAADGSDLDFAGRMEVRTGGFALADIAVATGGRWSGVIGTTYVWATDAATAGNISTLYNSGKGMSCADASSVDPTMDHCWDMIVAGGPYIDQIGSEDLTGTNTPTRVHSLVEQSDSGMSVNLVRASTQALTLVDNADLSLGADTDMCVAAWINPTAVNVAQFLVAKGTGSTAPDVEYWLYAMSDDARFGVGDGTNFSYAQVTAGLTANEWHLLIGCHDSTLDLVTVEVNGVEATTAHSSGTQDLAGVFAVGKGGNADTNFADAAIDNVAVWKRVLSTSEKATLWNAGAGTFYAAFLDFIFNGPRFAWSAPPEIRRLPE